MRKAKNQKVVICCSTKRDAEKVENALKLERNLVVSEATKKLPRVIIWDVMSFNSDEDIIESLQRQNSRLYDGIGSEECAKIKYRLKSRNSLQCHVVLETTPALWRRMTEVGKVFVGMQRCRVEERTPLLQCGKCLGFEHTRVNCRVELESSICAYCSQPGHEARNCSSKNCAPPVCVNCSKAKLKDVEHTAFSNKCPVKAKWEAIARAAVTYC